MAAVAELIKRVQLTQHLGVGLSAGDSPVELNNVTELTGKRTASRELHADVQIMLKLQEIEPGDRALRHIDRELFGLEDSFPSASFPRSDELIDDALGFAEHLKVCLAVKVGDRGHARTADHNRFSPRAKQLNDFDCIEVLRKHTAGHDQVGPFNIVVR